MPSDYEAFYVMEEDENGIRSAVGAGVDVEVHDLDLDANITTLTTDSEGLIAAGTLAVDAGTRVSFRVENYSGLSNSTIQITT